MKLRYPIRIYMEITSRCNFNCIHCYLGDNKSSGLKDIPLSLVRKATREMEEIGIFTLIVGGGEPLMHPHFSRIIQHLSSLRMLPAITTNGYFVDADFITTLKSAAFQGSVQVSIHGITPETHNHLVGHPEGFRHAMSAIKQLLAHGITVSTATAVTRRNIKEIPALLKKLEAIGVTTFNVVFLLPVGKASTDLMVRPPEHKNLLECIRSMKKRYTIFTDYNLMFESTDYLKNPLFPYYCTCGVVHATIDPEGNVFPCSLLKHPQFLFGNIRTNHLKEIFDNPKNDTTRQIFGVSPPECKGCKFEEVCKGGCRAVAFNSYKRLLAPDIRCPQVIP